MGLILQNEYPLSEPRDDLQYLKELGCVAYWDLARDKGNKIINLAGTQRLDATNNNTTKLPRGRYFDGSGYYISIPNDTTIDFTSKLSIETIIRPMGTTSGFIFCKNLDSGVNAQYALQYDYSNKKLNFTLEGTAISTTTNSIYTNTTYHILVTWDGSYARLYVNGKLNNGGARVTTLTSRANVAIGRRAAASYFNGNIAYLRLYNNKLTTNTAFNLYKKYYNQYKI